MLCGDEGRITGDTLYFSFDFTIHIIIQLISTTAPGHLLLLLYIGIGCIEYLTVVKTPVKQARSNYTANRMINAEGSVKIRESNDREHRNYIPGLSLVSSLN